MNVIRHSSTKDHVLVIGGGLAGMYAAIAAWEQGAKVTIFSKGRVGASGNSLVAMSVHRFAPDAPGLREEYRGRAAVHARLLLEMDTKDNYRSKALLAEIMTAGK